MSERSSPRLSRRALLKGMGALSALGLPSSLRPELLFGQGGRDLSGIRPVVVQRGTASLDYD